MYSASEARIRSLAQPHTLSRSLYSIVKESKKESAHSALHHVLLLLLWETLFGASLAGPLGEQKFSEVTDATRLGYQAFEIGGFRNTVSTIRLRLQLVCGLASVRFSFEHGLELFPLPLAFARRVPVCHEFALGAVITVVGGLVRPRGRTAAGRDPAPSVRLAEGVPL
jgi:hypothetical protein